MPLVIEALYIHIPFCASRCSYCAFATEATSDAALMDAYTEALVSQLRRASRAGLLGGVRTIYIGGGTPTHLGRRRLGSLCYAVSLSVCLENVREYTVEANPESLDAPLVRDLYALGVDRFSLGVQSFDDDILAKFGRPHTADDARRAISAVLERTDRLSIDLICGAPGQPPSSWEAGVREAVHLGATHMSVYPLSVEEGTPLERSVLAGRIASPDDDAQADMMLSASRILADAGFHRYEIASFALPGRESLHNTAYWTGVEYLGLGAAAASMLSPASWQACLDAGIFESPRAGETDGHMVTASGIDTHMVTAPAADVARIRVSARPDPAAWAASPGSSVRDIETLDARESVLEDVMLGMRMSRGIDASLTDRAIDLVPELPATLSKLADEGLVTSDASGTRPTERGWLLGNEIFSAIWNLA